MHPLLPVIHSCLAAVAVAAEPPAFTGKAVSDTDGNTLWVLDDDKLEHAIRLAGLDDLERRQPLSTVARDRLASI
jgi:endonuclease YncB( thermonuclease family)